MKQDGHVSFPGLLVFSAMLNDCSHFREWWLSLSLHQSACSSLIFLTTPHQMLDKKLLATVSTAIAMEPKPDVLKINVFIRTYIHPSQPAKNSLHCNLSNLMLRNSAKKLSIREFRCYETKQRRVKRPAVSGSWTQDTSGFSHQCSATEPWQPDNH